MKAVVIESVKSPGTTKTVAPVFADILCTLGLYRRRDLAVTLPPAMAGMAAYEAVPDDLRATVRPPAKPPKKPRATPKTPARPKRAYKTRRLTAEE